MALKEIREQLNREVGLTEETEFELTEELEEYLLKRKAEATKFGGHSFMLSLEKEKKSKRLFDRKNLNEFVEKYMLTIQFQNAVNLGLLCTIGGF